MKYKITDEQMRFILWLQIISLFILWGFVFLPVTIFYYLGWKKYNLEEGTQFFSFLFKKKDNREVKDTIDKTTKPVVTLIRKIIGLFFALALLYPTIKAIESFIVFFGGLFVVNILGLPYDEEIIMDLEALGSIIGLVSGVMFAKSIYTTVVGTNKEKEKSGVVKIILSILFILVYVMGIFAWIALSDKSEQNITTNLEDALYGTNQTEGDHITQVLSEIFIEVKKGGAVYFKNSLALDNSDILEISSYETREDLMRSITTVKASIVELENSEISHKKLQSDIELAIKNTELLSEKEKVEALNSFNENKSDVTKDTYRRERSKTLTDFYRSVLSYYEFLYKNFDDYVIQADENNERNIAFYSDINITTANNWLADISKKATTFEQADKKYMDYMQTSLNEMGVDMKATDIQNALLY